MPLAKRNPLAAIYTALAFAAIACPYVYLCSRVLTMFPPAVLLVLVGWLVPCTALLLFFAVPRSPRESALGQRLGRAFRPLCVILGFLAAGSDLLLLAVLSNYTMFTPPEYWYHLVQVFGPVAGVMLLVTLLLRPTRLEEALAQLFGPERPVGRLLGLAVLLLLAAGVVFAVYRFHVFSQPRPV